MSVKQDKKKCIDCGKDISDRGNRAIRCNICQKKHKKMLNNRKVKEFRAKDKKKRDLNVFVKKQGTKKPVNRGSILYPKWEAKVNRSIKNERLMAKERAMGINQPKKKKTWITIYDKALGRRKRRVLFFQQERNTCF